MVNSEEFIGTTKYLMLQTKCRINWRCYNWVQLHFQDKICNIHFENFHPICWKPRKLMIILTDTDFTALINFLFSRIFSILLSCVGIRLDLNLMSRIQIPLLPASTMILYTIFSSLSPPFTFWAVEGSFSL